MMDLKDGETKLNNLEEYKAHFQPVFTKDLNFSKKFYKETNAIIMRNLSFLINNETNNLEQDQKGYDRTLKIPTINYGVRIRRQQYQHYWEFTVDEQEWRKPTYPHIYLYGYGELNDQQKPKPLSAYILFDYQKFRKLAKQNIIKHSIQQNQKHSLVRFLCFKLEDIFKHNLVIDYSGNAQKTLSGGIF